MACFADKTMVRAYSKRRTFYVPMVDVMLKLAVIHFAAYETFGVEDGILWIGIESVFCSVADAVWKEVVNYDRHGQLLFLGKGDP